MQTARLVIKSCCHSLSVNVTVIRINDILIDKLKSFGVQHTREPLLRSLITDLVLPPTKLNDDRPPSHHVTIHKLHSSLCLLHSCSGRHRLFTSLQRHSTHPYCLRSQQRKLDGELWSEVTFTTVLACFAYMYLLMYL